MVVCKRRGCGAELVDGKLSGPCVYHPGAPVFHEGLKSWSCCNEKNKPVMEFEQFLQLPGCATADTHTEEKQPLPEAPAKSGPATTETESVSQSLSAVTLSSPAPPPAAPTAPAAPEPEARDPPTLTTVKAGTACRRAGCKYVAESDIEARDPSAETCRYHRGTPIFHEGSKGYTCCKRRVLHFDDFLAIEPCTTAEHGHLFSDVSAQANAKVECRVDYYETPKDVRVTVYAKNVDANESQIEIRENEVLLSLLMAPTQPTAEPRRFVRTLQPYAAVDPSASSHSLGKMKLDLVLVKKNEGQSWPALERGEPVYGYGLTFGRQK